MELTGSVWQLCLTLLVLRSPRADSLSIQILYGVWVGSIIIRNNPFNIMTEHNNYTHISTATTTVVKSTRGILKRITLNETTAGSVTVYDNTAGSGTVVATIAASVTARTLDYDAVLSTGITVVTAGADDITVIYS